MIDTGWLIVNPRHTANRHHLDCCAHVAEQVLIELPIFSTQTHACALAVSCALFPRAPRMCHRGTVYGRHVRGQRVSFVSDCFWVGSDGQLTGTNQTHFLVAFFGLVSVRRHRAMSFDTRGQYRDATTFSFPAIFSRTCIVGIDKYACFMEGNASCRFRVVFESKATYLLVGSAHRFNTQSRM